jgi:Zn-dependent protease with chaperone function
MSAFLGGYWGMYVVQAFLHSALSAALVGSSLLAWNVRDPSVKQRFRLIVIFTPLLAFPLYQAVSPDRGSVYFRLGALLDSSRWLNLPLWWDVPLAALFAVLFALTALVFLLQEFVPILMHMLERAPEGGGPGGKRPDEEVRTKAARAMEALPLPEDAVDIITDEDLFLYSSTGLSPRIYISSGLVRELTIEQLEGALAHELAHVRRSRKPVLILAYVFRVAMFYNPVAMAAFRKVAQDEEKICDDVAIELGSRPEALAEAVSLFCPEEESDTRGSHRLGAMASALEQHSHEMLLKSRIARLRDHPAVTHERWKGPFALTLAAVLVLNYYVV